MAMAACAARREASSIDSIPKTAPIDVGLSSSIRPPKLRTLSISDLEQRARIVKAIET